MPYYSPDVDESDKPAGAANTAPGEHYLAAKVDFASSISPATLNKRSESRYRGPLGKGKHFIAAFKQGIRHKWSKFRDDAKQFGPVGGAIYTGAFVLVLLLWIPVLILALPIIILVLLFFWALLVRLVRTTHHILLISTRRILSR